MNEELNNFHYQIRRATHHELVQFIEAYSVFIQKSNKNKKFNILTPETFWTSMKGENEV